jgi:hypothetical protein
MLDGVRDVSAVFTLDRALGRLREEYLDLAHAGQPPGPSFWEDGAARILRFVQDSHFSHAVRIGLDPGDRRGDDQAWAERQSVTGEEAALWTHERLRALPFVGDGVHDLPAADPPTGDGEPDAPPGVSADVGRR